MRFSSLIGAILGLPYSIFCNFRYLPFKQAKRIPLLISPFCFVKGNGSMYIEGDISFGMIKIGFGRIRFYSPNQTTIICNGKIIFNGYAHIGNSCKLVINAKATLSLGYNFSVSAGLRLGCSESIIIGNNCLIGWGCTILDSDKHSLYINGLKQPVSSPIKIGEDNWICQSSTILKGSSTPNKCVLGSNSLLSKDFSKYSEKILLCGIPARIVKTDVWHNPFDD